MIDLENIELISELITGRVKPHIYAFTTNTIPNYLKVGDTYRALTVRLNEWRKHFPNLQQVYSNPASIDDEIFFRDYAVHDFLIHEKGKYRLLIEDMVGFPPGTYYSKEFLRILPKPMLKKLLLISKQATRIMTININSIMPILLYRKHIHMLQPDIGLLGPISRKQLIIL